MPSIVESSGRPQRFTLVAAAALIACLVPSGVALPAETTLVARAGDLGGGAAVVDPARGPLKYQPHALSFGKVNVGTSTSKPLSLGNPGSVPIKIIRISSSGSGYSASQNCIGTLAANGGSCEVEVTFSPIHAKNPKGTKVPGTLTLTDNAANNPQRVALSAVLLSPTPTPTPGGFAIQAAGFYRFATDSGIVSPQIIEYATDTSTGFTSQSGAVTTGSGLESLAFTRDGKHGYGLDSSGNLWGYSVQSATGMLTSLGILKSNLPTGSGPSTAPILGTYESRVLWVAMNSTPGNMTVNQYPINADGTLGMPTMTTLSGSDFDPFLPPGSSVPTAIWAFSDRDSNSVATLNVYPVNVNGTINSTSIQTVTVPPLIQPLTGAFTHGISGPFGGTQTLNTFGLNSNGTLTTGSSIALPATTGLWRIANLVGAAVGNESTIDLIDTSFAFVVYPVSPSGSVGTKLQSTSFAASPQFPYSVTPGVPKLSALPTIWVLPWGSSSIDEFPITADGTIGAMSGSVPKAASVTLLQFAEPPVPPFCYGIDTSSGNIYAYQVDSSSGALMESGSFAAPSPGIAEFVFPFKPAFYSNKPVALFVYTVVAGKGFMITITVYPIGANGMPSGGPLSTISSSDSMESYLVQQNGQLFQFAFGVI